MRGEKELSLELVEEAATSFNIAVQKANERMDLSLPHMLFQEKHVSGHLWWKKTYYVYYKYFEGSMLAVHVFPMETLDQHERGK